MADTIPTPSVAPTSNGVGVSDATIKEDQPSAESTDHNYKFSITMTCGGCSGAVERVLGRLDGVKSFTVSLPMQTAEVRTADNISYDAVLEKIKKTGKKVNAGEADGKTGMPI